MESVLDILLSIQNTSGTNDKLEILKQNIDNQELKDILFYTYNPFYVYGISGKKINKDLPDMTLNISENKIDNIIDLFKFLRVNNTGSNQICYKVQQFIKNQPEQYQQLYKDIITKDLTLGVNVKSINKVWKDLIPVYEVQQGERLYDNLDRIYKENLDIIVTQKFDGQRCSARVQDGNVLLYSRNGKVYEGLIDLQNQLSKLPNGMYDGELLLDYKLNKHNDLFSNTIEENNMIDGIYVPKIESKELFKKTASIVNSDMEDKKNINIWLYDYTSLDSFDTFTDFKQPTSYRKSHLENLINNLQDCPNIKNTPILYQGKMNENIVNNLLDKVIGLGQEGLMINIANANYEYKRSKNMLKVKKMYTVDLKVIDVEEGSGLNKGKLGALVVNYKGFNVSVGSGLTKEQREYWWQNKQDILNKIIEVQYFEETTNKKDSSVSLRFPVFKQVRNDKSEESYF